MQIKDRSIVDYILEKRGYKSEDEKKAFLNPNYESIHDPFFLKGMKEGVERFLSAIIAGEKIGIFSDYDADGIPGAAILTDFLEKIEYKNYVLYLPNRETEGFGLSILGIDSFIKEKVSLIITIDCGITDIEEVAYANKNKIDCIITDHHLPGDRIPDAIAVIDAKQKGCKYPFKELCGSGVIWKFVSALILSIHSDTAEKNLAQYKEKIFVGYEKWLLDLVAIATCSDMVPLVGENRTLVHFGLKVLQKNKRPGLQSLLRFLRIDSRNLTEEDISFSITPRINAASRMSHPIDAYNMLSARDVESGEKHARHLNELNDERKGHVAQLVKQAKKKISNHYDDIENIKSGNVVGKVIFVGDVTWKPGLLGLIANSLMNDFNCPVFVWGRGDGEEIKGSARSPVDGLVDIMKMSQEKQNLFVDYGGHERSGGFGLRVESVDIADQILNDSYISILSQKTETVKTKDDKSSDGDISIQIQDLNSSLWSDVQSLAPFGIGNLKPIFKIENSFIKNAKVFGKTKEHVECVLTHNDPIVDGDEKFVQSRREYKAIHFFSKFVDKVDGLIGKTGTFLTNCEISYFGGKTEKRFRIIDIIEK